MSGPSSSKRRLDQVVGERPDVRSREEASRLIRAGKVFVDDRRVSKPGTVISPTASIRVDLPDHPYVSRGGVKLEAALDSFRVDPREKICLDAGASTGGFTDCLLRRGATKVHAVDVGYGQLAWSLRQDERVVVHERTNVRHLEPAAIGEAVELIVVDVSFISLTKVLPALSRVTAKRFDLIALVKPQFEAGRDQVGKGGVVRDELARRASVERVLAFASTLGLARCGATVSPLRGPAGNQEFFVHLADGEEQDRESTTLLAGLFDARD